MVTPLRLGFLFSGLLHVAVVAAFSLSLEQDEIPAVDEPMPLTLKLALFQPPQEAPDPPAPAEPAPPEPVAEPLAAEPPVQQEEVMPSAEPVPAPVVKRVAAKPPKPKPRPRVKPVVKVKPAARKPEAARPRVSMPLVNPPVTLVAARPRAVISVVEMQEKQHYLAALAASINRSKFYPLASRRRGEEGRVVVRFLVQKNGDLTDLSVVESSGSRRLDAAALKTLRRVTPFRPIPETLHRDNWSISVPIAFSLRG